MIHHDMAYRMATQDHQARIAAAARSRELRAARTAMRSDTGHSWLAAVGRRFKGARAAASAVVEAGGGGAAVVEAPPVLVERLSPA